MGKITYDLLPRWCLCQLFFAEKSAELRPKLEEPEMKTSITKNKVEVFLRIEAALDKPVVDGQVEARIFDLRGPNL